MSFVIGDPVINRWTRKRGKIIGISDKWGWYKVEYENGYVKMYEYYDVANKLACMIDPGD